MLMSLISKKLLKSFRIILEKLRRRVWIKGRIIQGIIQVLGQKKYKILVKRKEKHENENS